MKLSQLILIIVLSAVAAFATVYIASDLHGEIPGRAKASMTRFDNIKRTGVLRCGYINEPPFEIKDPNTGQMSGMGVELAEEIGKQLNLTIKWESEVSYGQMLMDLSLNRYDMICAPFYACLRGGARPISPCRCFTFPPISMCARTMRGSTTTTRAPTIRK